MSNPTINVSVTVVIADGIASFGYEPDGPYNVTESTSVVFSFSNTGVTKLSFVKPLISYFPAYASRDITSNLTEYNQKLTLSDTDTDIDKETIGVQIVVEDTYGNAYASPDPRILDIPPNSLSSL